MPVAAPPTADPATTAPEPAARRLEPRLEVAPYDFAAALALERRLGLSHTLAQVLVRRGLGDPAEARRWLEAAAATEPPALAGTHSAVEAILGHVRAGSRIAVHGDYDVDGVCATAIAVRVLRRLGADVDWFLPARMEDGYGLSAATVERLAARGTRLILTVDCAITAVAEVAAARAAGLDVVVTDHHAPRADGALPDAPIVHPGLGDRPCPDLCAAGVAHRLARALAAAAGEDPATADEDLDLVGLATVADVVSLRGENRPLVRAGLRALASTAKPGLRALMRVARVDPGRLDARALAFGLAPRLNAAGRLHRADAGLELLLTTDEARALAVAEELDAANVERRAVETRILFEAEAQVAQAGERASHVLAGEGWHPGVIGIVAARIAERHHRPTILIALDGEEGTGSGRSIAGFDLLSGLTAAAEHLLRYGGHRAAAGLTIARDGVEAFRHAFEAHAARALGPDHLVPVERVDAVVAGDALGLALAEELAALEPCGMGNPGAKLLVPAATFSDPRPMGEGRHVRFTLNAAGLRSRAVAFRCGGRLPVPLDVPVDATFGLEVSEWNGAVEPRLVLRSARRCRPRPIEVLGEPEGAEGYLATALAELDADLDDPSAARVDRGGEPAREVVDRRGPGAAGLLADLVATGEPVLAVVADVPRRLAGLAERVGGFALCGQGALERDHELGAGFRHVVVLDPPTDRVRRERLDAARASGFIHLAWADAELRFAGQMHELEFDTRAPLAALYRLLRTRPRWSGEALAGALRGDGGHGRPAASSGRLVRVLSELGLVEVDRDAGALAVAPAPARTALERSPAHRHYIRRLEDGRRFLSAARARAAAA